MRVDNLTGQRAAAPAALHKFKLPIKTRDTLAAFIKYAFGVTVPSVAVIEGHSTPWDAFCDAYFAEHRVTVWKASRGFGGKSYLLALLSLTEALTLKCDVSVLGGSGQQSRRVQNYISSDFYEYKNAPQNLWVGDPLVTRSEFIWGNEIEALMASTRAARSGHPPRIRLDEVDEMSRDVYTAVSGQTMSSVENGEIIVPAQTVISSTHHRSDGMMTESLKRAKERKGWSVHEWSYHETSNPVDGWLLQSEIDGKRIDVTDRMWVVEYDLQEPSVEDRAIMTERVDQMFGIIPDTLDEHDPNFYYAGVEVEGALGQYYEFEPPDHKAAAAEYYTMADWAKDVDFTIVITIRTDVSPARVVAFERRGREDWKLMTQRFEKQVTRYNSWAAHDSTGVGDVVDDFLTVFADGFKMVGQARTEMINQAIGAIEAREIISPYIAYFHGELKYMTTADLSGGRSGHLPDTMASFSCGWRLYRDHNPRGVGDVDTSDLGKVENFENKYA